VPRRRRVRALGLLVACSFVGFAGCGPVEYMNQVRGRAVAAIVQAQRQGAQQLAPYEFTAASAYLEKAREEGARSSYQVAIRYGRRAEELAARAEAIARERRARAGAQGMAPPP
jgi:hypothetical protein